MKRTITFISIIFLSLLSIFSFNILDDGDDFEIAKSFDIFHNVIREIRLFYVDDVDISKLINESTSEFLAKLDPYTVFYPEDKIEDFSFMTTGAYGGVGAILVDKENSLLLVEIYKNSPADKSGLKVGDEIVAVNNINITNDNILEVKTLLKGEPESDVNISIKRHGVNKFLKKTITREKIKIDNIPHSEILNEKFAYVKLSVFKNGAANDIRKKLLEMKSKRELQGVILDLRGNPGGLLNEAVNIVSLFVKKGSNIVYTKGKVANWNNSYKAQIEPLFPNVPLVILINSNSASASEIVAGAIQDLDRGVIIGQRSFGKGLVQATRKLSYNTRIKITTAKYYIPSGRCIQAIDYSHRNEDGSVGHIPDSLISEFKTLSGRKVYDGGGIKPDIEIALDTLSSFTKQLINNNSIFDFTTKFYYENKSIDSANIFNITTNIYNDFTNYIEKKNIKISSESYYLAGELLKSAKKDKFSKEIISKIKYLQNTLNIDLKRNMNLFKSQISPILEKSIIGRYYYNKGKVISSMKFDKELNEAKKILENKQKYSFILSSSKSK